MEAIPFRDFRVADPGFDLTAEADLDLSTDSGTSPLAGRATSPIEMHEYLSMYGL